MVRLPYTILVSLFVLSGQPQRALAGCSLKATSYPPVVTTEFGSKLLLSESSETYEREDGEEINLFCGSGLDMNFITDGGYGSQYNSAGPQIMLKCLSSYFDINGDTARNLEVSCKGRVSQMFESKTSLPKCSNYMTLVLAYNFQDKGTIKNAAMCYDILEAQLKYISYTSFSTRKRIIEENQAGQLNNLGLDISVAYRKNLVKNFSQDDIDTYLKKERHLSELFGNGVFEYKNLLQDESAGKSLIGYDDMFNIIWLKNLRTGSWKLWLNALRAATEAGTQFDIRLGVSGTLNLPRTSMNPCMNYTEHLVIEPKAPGSSSVRVPAYIWAHVHTLKPMGHAGGQDEFVIIGHNSPFSVNATEVCSSMCHQVSWLKDTLFARLREYPAYGLVQCCHVKDVAHKLDNFPGAFVTETASPTAASTTSTPVPELPQWLPTYVGGGGL